MLKIIWFQYGNDQKKFRDGLEFVHYGMKIILRITSSLHYKSIFRNFIKYNSLLNYCFEKQQISNLYIEAIENGLVVVFKSYKGFLKFLPVFSESEVKMVKQNFVNREKNYFKISDDFSTQSFPKNGLEIFFSPISEHSNDLVDHLILHFKSLNIEDIEITRKNSFKIIIKFKNLKSLIEYRNFIEHFINRKINSVDEIIN